MPGPRLQFLSAMRWLKARTRCSNPSATTEAVTTSIPVNRRIKSLQNKHNLGTRVFGPSERPRLRKYFRVSLLPDRVGCELRWAGKICPPSAPMGQKPGPRGDVRAAIPPVIDVPPTRMYLAADAYGAKNLRQFLTARGTLQVVPNYPTRKPQHPFDPWVRRARNRIERTIGHLKNWRRVATRYDRRSANCASAVALALTIQWGCRSTPEAKTATGRVRGTGSALPPLARILPRFGARLKARSALRP